MKNKITVGTRGSKLALTQTTQVVEKLKQAVPGLEVDFKIIKTTGDKILDKTLSKIGGKGLFIKEIEEALAAKEVDFAVHSFKDVPHTMPKGFEIGAVLEREDPRDVIICRDNYDLSTLPTGLKVGTGSLRRMLQIKQARPDLEILPVRGNIDTRATKLALGEFDAIILAASGLKRMGWSGNVEDEFLSSFIKEGSSEGLKISFLDTETCIPAVGQGALALEIREGDKELFDIVNVLNHEVDATGVKAERAFLKEVDGGCEIPIGAYAKIINNQIQMDGFIGDEKTYKIYKSQVVGDLQACEQLGIKLAKDLINRKEQ